MRKQTKIICTMGPSTENDDVLRDMLKAGMNVARLNFSHGSHEYHRKNIERVRRIAKEVHKNVAIIADTKGPEIRTGETKDHKPVQLQAKQHTIITVDEVEGTSERFSLDYKTLPKEVKQGSVIFIDDGLLRLEVEHVDGNDIHCIVVDGGELNEHKGVNIPNLKLNLPAISEQDKLDIAFACEMEVDAIAASFVCEAKAVNQIRSLCAYCGAPYMLVFSKIESALAVSNFDEILEASDGIMVARGDLGIEIPPAKVPYTQKEIIRKCNEKYKTVITATQMLESMRHSPRPTRAEAADVANAIFDGSDCVMLSGETAAGKYPLQSVRMMTEICVNAEEHLDEKHDYHDMGGLENVGGATSFGAVETAQRVGAVALLCPTNSGKTARTMSVFRPKLPILATSPLPAVVRRTCFYWGVIGLLTEEQQGLAKTCYDALKTARDNGFVKDDELVVITAGDPLSSPFTNSGYETATNVCMVAQAL